MTAKKKSNFYRAYIFAWDVCVCVSERARLVIQLCLCAQTNKKVLATQRRTEKWLTEKSCLGTGAIYYNLCVGNDLLRRAQEEVLYMPGESA